MKYLNFKKYMLCVFIRSYHSLIEIFVIIYNYILNNNKDIPE